MVFLSQKVQSTLKQNDFKRKGHTFFRVSGENILQIVKLEHESCGNIFHINIGMQSLYSEMLPQWFTASGCITKYPVCNTLGQRFSGMLDSVQDINKSLCMQEDILLRYGIEWLNSITSQKKLLDGLLYLETSWGGEAVWIDQFKIAPALCCNDFIVARRVVEAILEQHKVAQYFKKRSMPKEQYESYIQIQQSKDAYLNELLKMIDADNVDDIQFYLSQNLAINLPRTVF